MTAKQVIENMQKEHHIIVNECWLFYKKYSNRAAEIDEDAFWKEVWTEAREIEDRHLSSAFVVDTLRMYLNELDLMWKEYRFELQKRKETA